MYCNNHFVYIFQEWIISLRAKILSARGEKSAGTAGLKKTFFLQPEKNLSERIYKIEKLKKLLVRFVALSFFPLFSFQFGVVVLMKYTQSQFVEPLQQKIRNFSLFLPFGKRDVISH